MNEMQKLVAQSRLELLGIKAQARLAAEMARATRNALAALSPEFDKEYLAQMEKLLQSIAPESSSGQAQEEYQALLATIEEGESAQVRTGFQTEVKW